jgi:SnoaL-like domain
MRRWMGPSASVIVLAAGVALAGAPAEAAAQSTAPTVKGLVAASESSSPEAFDALMEVQALYDEISQVDVPFVTPEDFEQFHAVIYTPDFVYVDASGRKQTWADLHAPAAESGPPDSMVQRVDRLSLTPDGATTIVTVTTIRTAVDTAGKNGRPGASHTLTETDVYRDSWVRDSDGWRLKSREQLRPSRVAVDRPEWG